MAGVAGQWSLSVKVGGKELPLNPSNLSNLAIINNIHQFMPVLQMAFKDSASVLNGDLSAVADGTDVSIDIGHPSHHVYEGRKFKLTGSPNKVPGLSYSTISVDGLFHMVDWTRKVIDKHHEGTSADVIRAVGEAVGWKVKADATKDAMTWLPNNTILAQFAQHVAARGWAGAQSIMMLAASDSGVLAYRDADKLARSSPIKTLASNPRDGDVYIRAHAAASKSAVTNAANAYGSTSMGMKPDGTWFEINKIASTLLSGRLSVGDAISAVQTVSRLAEGGADGLINGLLGDAKKELGRRIEQFAPIAGNTHDKWYEAQHQNRRGRSLYAYDVAVISDMPLQVDLLDLVRLIPVDQQTGKVDEALVGNYVVTSNTKFMNGNGYAEKAVLTSQGTN